jgi:hypothetical protein
MLVISISCRIQNNKAIFLECMLSFCVITVNLVERFLHFALAILRKALHYFRPLMQKTKFIVPVDGAKNQ